MNYKVALLSGLFQQCSKVLRDLKTIFNKHVYLLTNIPKIKQIYFQKAHANKVCMKSQGDHVQTYLFQFKFKQNTVRTLGMGYEFCIINNSCKDQSTARL